MRVRSTVAALLLCLLCLPAFAAPKCPDPIQSFTPSDAQTGTPVTMTWSLGDLIPQSLTLTGHDFENPVVLAPNQLTYSYVPDKPGEKHVTLTVVTDCGTFSLTRKYHVKQCNVVTPILNVDKTSAAPGETITASIDLLPGHTARWVVQNGTASATSGASIHVVAGAPGSVSIDVYVARGNSCEVKTGTVIPIVQPCAITEPPLSVTSGSPAPNEFFGILLLDLPAGQTATFAVTGAQVVYRDAYGVGVIAPATGSFSIDLTLSNSTCSRTFVHAYEVTPCAPTAVISGGSGSCDSATLIADFTGTAPFQGFWSDGQFFFTNESHLERTVTTSGTYTINFFRDARCRGTVSGSAQVGASVSNPAFTIDDAVNGFYYGVDTCPNLERIATLSVPVPNGWQPMWSVDNGTMLSGQGTSALHFAGINPGATTVSVVFQNAQGCTSQPATQQLFTNGSPQIGVSVDPQSIGAGGTAIVTVTRLNNYVRGFGVESSLGDSIVPIGSNGNTTQYEYRSTHGGGVAAITATATNVCNESTTATTTLSIDGGNPVGAKATVRALGTSCQDYLAMAELTGVPPFSGRWSNGETFFQDYPYAFLRPPTGGTYTLVEFSDANGPGTISGEATFNFTGLPQPEIAFSATAACPNGTVTASLTNPLPDGATVRWFLGSGGTIVSGQGTSSIQIQTDGDGVNVYVQVSAPGACSPDGYAYLPGGGSFVQPPQFTLYGVYAGNSTEFFVMLDPATATWGFENSLGDAMEIVSSPFPNAYLVRYTSSHGVGESTVRIYGTTQCGTPFEATQVMTIFPMPPQLMLTSEPGASCGAVVTATITGGTAPYTIYWSDTGLTETTNETTVRHIVNYSQYIYATVTDANGATGGSNFIFAEATLLPYVPFSMTNQICLGGQATFEAQPLEGAEIIWTIEGPNLRIVSGQGTSQLVVEGVEAGTVHVNVKYRTLDGCDGLGSGGMIEVSSAYCPTNP